MKRKNITCNEGCVARLLLTVVLQLKQAADRTIVFVLCQHHCCFFFWQLSFCDFSGTQGLLFLVFSTMSGKPFQKYFTFQRLERTVKKGRSITSSQNINDNKNCLATSHQRHTKKAKSRDKKRQYYCCYKHLQKLVESIKLRIQVKLFLASFGSLACWHAAIPLLNAVLFVTLLFSGDNGIKDFFIFVFSVRLQHKNFG